MHGSLDHTSQYSVIRGKCHLRQVPFAVSMQWRRADNGLYCNYRLDRSPGFKKDGAQKEADRVVENIVFPEIVNIKQKKGTKAMLGCDLIALLEQAGRRYHVVGDERNGVLAALDVEGRLFAIQDGKVRNRVNVEALCGISTREGYLNPGGDGFWPAPEGSRLGYEYSTDGWRVPPGLTNARWQVKKCSETSALMSAEVDLINALGIGLPCLFSRGVLVSTSGRTMTVKVVESIAYLGTREYDSTQCLLAPWTLCQFDCGPGCELRITPVTADDIWDLYDRDSSSLRRQEGETTIVSMQTDFRFQLGLSPQVKELVFVDRGRGFQARRTALPLTPGLEYIDIADRDPGVAPTGRPVSLSAYCDPSGFMEIEAAGGAPSALLPGAVTSLTVITEYQAGF
ncbi:MAG: hypothetical protein BWX73_01749 [Lentisphaerae bacterium ADurb.Bin082]|nr:MAG: hypothetical protein BWX73_01749 [Lentisphaerae bacterium ADurb.Bin082]